ncbi:MAG: hypothetical protein JWM78_2110 [Verrucomicrobiaceae bacterium]|nr:hypothetical protein [Verrucomicrobiaceae bacterium]
MAVGHSLEVISDTGATSPLYTADQIAAEQLAIDVLGLPETHAIWATLREQLRDDMAMQKPDGPLTLERSLTLWATFLTIRECAGDVARPKIIWGVENSAHQWGGINFPGSGVAGDNPDNIYRSSFINGISSYEVRGVRPAHAPTQFSIEVTRGGPGFFLLSPQTPGTPDLGDQVALFSDRDLIVDADGRFTVTLDTKPANGRINHIQIELGPQAVNFRDSLSDWSARPHQLDIIRTDGPAAGPQLTRDEIIRRTLIDMPAFTLFWALFKNHWLGTPAVNTLPQAVPRDGGWGFLAGGHFDLADDEAILVTTIPAGARYTGVQVTNPWMMANDGALAFTSRNMSQVTPNAQGEVTYVISKRDVGAPNWIDTTGLRQGIVIFRWQQTAANTQAHTLLRDFRIVKVADIGNLLPPDTPWVSVEQRADELARRTASYHLRLQ